MAKTADNRQGKSGKGKPASGGKAAASGKAASGGKSVAKRPDAKPARRGQSRTRTAAARAKSGERRGLGRFLHDVRIELGKVTWPTRKDLIQSTIVVLVAVGIATAYTGVLDFVFAKAVDVVLSVIT